MPTTYQDLETQLKAARRRLIEEAGAHELLKAQLADAHKRLIEETKTREYLQIQVADLGRQLTVMRQALRDIAEQVEVL